MSDQDDLYGVTQPLISDELAERILSGSGQDAASVGLDVVFGALRAPADPSELSGMDAMVTAFQGAVVTPIAGPPTPRTRPMRKKLLTAKTIAAIGAVTLVTAGAAAAATGTVPSPFASDKAQEVTSERVPDIARENVGKRVDDSSTVTETTLAVVVAPVDQTDANESASAEGTGPDATGAARFGLCTAYAAHVEHRDGTEPDGVPTTSIDLPAPFRNLTDAATAAGQTVEEFCADATPGRSESAPGQTDESPSATAPGQTGESPSATAPGQTGESPSATAPGQTGESPSATAPGQTDESPSATAPGQTDENPSATAPASGGEDNPSATAPGRP